MLSKSRSSVHLSRQITDHKIISVTMCEAHHCMIQPDEMFEKYPSLLSMSWVFVMETKEIRSEYSLRVVLKHSAWTLMAEFHSGISQK